MEQTLKNDTGDNTAKAHIHRSLDEARAGAAELAEQGNEILQNSTERIRKAWGQTTDQAAQYVQTQPLKSLLMAAAAGAAIAILASAIGKHHGRS